MTVDAFVDPLNFARIPDRPSYPFKAAGQEVIFVSRSKGTVKSTPGYDVIKMMPSYVHMDGLKSKGDDVDYTIDLVTGIGSVILMHKDSETVQRDIDFIRYLENINGFFVFETKLENLKRPRGEAVVLPKNQTPSPTNHHRRVFSSDGPSLVRIMSNDRPELGGFSGMGMLTKRMTTVDSSREAVVLVDPYSTGCCVAEEIMKRGFSVIALWTRGIAPEMKKHVPLSCGTLNYLAEVEESENLAGTSQVIYKAAGSLRVVACLAGGEAGEIRLLLLLKCSLVVFLTILTPGIVVASLTNSKVLILPTLFRSISRFVQMVPIFPIEEIRRYSKKSSVSMVYVRCDKLGVVTLLVSKSSSKQNHTLLS